MGSGSGLESWILGVGAWTGGKVEAPRRKAESSELTRPRHSWLGNNSGVTLRDGSGARMIN
jgi:hypothetical protein